VVNKMKPANTAWIIRRSAWWESIDFQPRRRDFTRLVLTSVGYNAIS
jgi:hypothetical protein